MNSKGECLKSLAESLGLSDVITYLETFSADSASEDTYNAHVLALEFLVLSVISLCPQILFALVLYSQQKSVFILALE